MALWSWLISDPIEVLLAFDKIGSELSNFSVNWHHGILNNGVNTINVKHDYHRIPHENLTIMQ